MFVARAADSSARRGCLARVRVDKTSASARGLTEAPGAAGRQVGETIIGGWTTWTSAAPLDPRERSTGRVLTVDPFSPATSRALFEVVSE